MSNIVQPLPFSIRHGFRSGFARNASQSEHPHFWNRLVGAWCPSVGIQGRRLEDFSGRGNHGTFSTNMGNDAWVPGPFGYTLRYDGTDDWVTLTTGLLSLNTDFTISAWFYVDDITHNAYTIVGNSVAGDQTKSYMILFPRDDRNGLTWQSDTGPGGAVLTTVPSKDVVPFKWTHVVMTRNQSSGVFAMLQDGLPIVGDSTNPNFSNPVDGTWGIGAYDSTNGVLLMKGGIGDVLIWNRNMTQREMSQLYEGAHPLTPSTDLTVSFSIPHTNVTINPSVLTATATLNAPSVSLSRSVSPATLTATATLNAPTISLSKTVSPATLTATATLNDPTVTIETNLPVLVSTLTATVTLNAPTVSIVNPPTPPTPETPSAGGGGGYTPRGSGKRRIEEIEELARKDILRQKKKKKKKKKKKVFEILPSRSGPIARRISEETILKEDTTRSDLIALLEEQIREREESIQLLDAKLEYNREQKQKLEREESVKRAAEEAVIATKQREIRIQLRKEEEEKRRLEKIRRDSEDEDDFLMLLLLGD